LGEYASGENLQLDPDQEDKDEEETDGTTTKAHDMLIVCINSKKPSTVMQETWWSKDDDMPLFFEEKEESIFTSPVAVSSTWCVIIKLETSPVLCKDENEYRLSKTSCIHVPSLDWLCTDNSSKIWEMKENEEMNESLVYHATASA
jgi:hypothetical protein